MWKRDVGWRTRGVVGAFELRWTTGSVVESWDLLARSDFQVWESSDDYLLAVPCRLNPTL